MGRLLRSVAWTALAALLSGGASAQAQSQVPAHNSGLPSARPSGSIHGTVTDERGSVISGAVVSALGVTVAVAETDAQGRFTLPLLQPDAYVLRAHLPGVASSGRIVVRVKPNEQTVSALQIQRFTQVLAGVGTTGLSSDFLTSALAGTATEEEAAQAESTPTAVAPLPAGDDHSSTAWRIRHARRSVLKNLTGGAAIAGRESSPSGFGGEPVAFLGRAVTSSGRFASSLFAELPWSGEFNLLTTSSFEGPRDLFSTESMPRGIAYVSIGAPSGQQGKWAVQGAMTQGDVASWLVAGNYNNRFRKTHRVGVALSYSTQRYDGGNAMALAAVTDGSRNVGSVSATDEWAFAKRATLTYGARYARYDYLAQSVLFSPQAGLNLSLARNTRLRAGFAQGMLAPGAEEFLPPALAGVWLPPERTFSPVDNHGVFRPERTRHAEIALEQQLTRDYSVGVRRFYQRVNDQLVTMFGMQVGGAPDADLGHYFVANGGNVDLDGWGATMTCNVANRLRGSVDYTYTTARWADSPEGALIAVWTPSAARRGSEQFHNVTTSVEADIPETATRVFVLYRVNSAYAGADPELSTPALDGRFDVRVHQRLPFMSSFTSTQWEVLVAVRNLFREAITDGSAYDELLVVRPPKRIVGGLLVRF